MKLISQLESIRNKWLKSWKAMIGYQIAAVVLSLLIGLATGWEDKGAIASVVLGTSDIVWLYFCYRCAYKKPGTKLLQSFIALNAIGIVKVLKSGQGLLIKNTLHC